MEQRNTRLRNAGFVTFFFSGICTISSGVVVSLLQEEYGFAYGMTGTLLSLLSIGNLLAGLLAGALVGKMGMKPSVLLLTIGYAVGYGLMGLTGLPILLPLAYRLGYQKARYAYYLCIGLLASFMGYFVSSGDNALNSLLPAQGSLLVLVVVLAAALALYALSWRLSVAWYGKAEQ